MICFNFSIEKILSYHRREKLENRMEDEDYAYSDEYYASLLWMAPEKLKEICRELITQGKDEIIQIDKETIIDKEQSVCNIQYVTSMG